MSVAGNTIDGGCTFCGGTVEIIDADEMDATADTLDIIEGPQWSKDLVQQLGLALNRILEEEPEDPISDLAHTNRELAAAVDRAVEAMQKTRPRTTRRRLALKVAAYLAGTVFAGVVGSVADHVVDAVLSDGEEEAGVANPQRAPEQIRREVERQLEEIARTGHLPRQQRPWAGP